MFVLASVYCGSAADSDAQPTAPYYRESLLADLNDKSCANCMAISSCAQEEAAYIGATCINFLSAYSEEIIDCVGQE